ncbi:MAG TPA: hypothetical protein VK395_32410 [Gemmataceae bacterium]|nr:hypothetical protein [Gemmataceae bacterium]
MPTFLFVTKPEYTPDRAKSGQDLSWSCSSTTRIGDHELARNMKSIRLPIYGRFVPIAMPSFISGDSSVL